MGLGVKLQSCRVAIQWLFSHPAVNPLDLFHHYDLHVLYCVVWGVELQYHRDRREDRRNVSPTKLSQSLVHWRL